MSLINTMSSLNNITIIFSIALIIPPISYFIYGKGVSQSWETCRPCVISNLMKESLKICWDLLQQ